MIEVKDRISMKPGRVKITLEDGSTLYATVERADEPIVSGTFINKDLFDNIRANVYLNGLYNQCSIENKESYQVLKLDYNLDKYEKGLIVNIDTTPTEEQEVEFNSRIFPYFTSLDPIDGYTLSGGWRMFDGDNSTAGWGTCIIYCPYPIKPKTIKIYATEDLSNNGNINGYGIKKDGTEVQLFEKINFSSKYDDIVTITTNDFFIGFKFESSPTYGSTQAKMNEISIESGTKLLISSNLPFYININNLGEKMIIGNIDTNKKYELIYDGVAFISREILMEEESS